MIDPAARQKSFHQPPEIFYTIRNQEMNRIPPPSYGLRDYLYDFKATLESMLKDRYIQLGAIDEMHTAAFLSLFEYDISSPIAPEYQKLVEQKKTWWKMSRPELAATAVSARVPNTGFMHKIIGRLVRTLDTSTNDCYVNDSNEAISGGHGQSQGTQVATPNLANSMLIDPSLTAGHIGKILRKEVLRGAN